MWGIKPSENFTIDVNDQKIWEDGNPIGSNNKISYDSKTDEFIIFEFQAGTYVIRAVDRAVF